MNEKYENYELLTVVIESLDYDTLSCLRVLR